MAEVWLKDVAKAAGVSVSAASHAVNGTGTLAVATRERILAVAAELGYERNPLLSRIAARRFRERKGETHEPVAVVSFAKANPRMGHYGDIPEGYLNEEGRSYGMQMQGLKVLATVEEAQRYLGRMERRGVRALLMLASDDPEFLEQLDLSRFCVLGAGDIVGACPYHHVERDWGRAVRMCYDRLSRAGCNRIGIHLLGRDQTTYHDRVRLGAFLSEQYSRADGEMVAPLISQSPDQQDPRNALRNYVETERLDGLIAWPLDPVYGLVESGMRIPEDLQVTLIRRFDVGRSEWYGPFAGVAALDRDQTRQVIQLLYNQLVHGERGKPRNIITHRLLGRWVPGTSLRE